MLSIFQYLIFEKNLFVATLSHCVDLDVDTTVGAELVIALLHLCKTVLFSLYRNSAVPPRP